MKCDKCGWDDKGTGDFAHVCGQVVGIRPNRHTVEMQRMTKKLNKMKDQRDKARAILENYKVVMRELPNLQRRYDDYQKWKKEQETINQMRVRINEQSLLIGKLTGKL